jgi:hypothetical protein
LGSAEFATSVRVPPVAGFWLLVAAESSLAGVDADDDSDASP